MKLPLKMQISILVAAFVLGMYAQYRLTPKAKPLPPAESLHEVDQGEKSKQTKTVKEVFNCPNGALSSRETTEALDLESFLKERAKVTVPVIPPAPPDNLLFNVDSSLRLGVNFKLPKLPVIDKVLDTSKVWTGYDKDLRTGEDIYKLGYSTRVF